jgi:hypothetical protein
VTRLHRPRVLAKRIHANSHQTDIQRSENLRRGTIVLDYHQKTKILAGKGILPLQCFCGMQRQFQRHYSGSLRQFAWQVHVELLGGIVIGGLKCVSALDCIQYIATLSPRVESCVVRDVKT